MPGTKTNNFLLVLFSVFNIVSCQKSTKENFSNPKNQDTYTLKISDTLIFPSDYKHSANTNFFSVRNNVLLQQNSLDNSIYAYDLITQEQLFKLILPAYGPDKIGKIQGFNYISEDSIYIITPLNNQIKLIDSKLNIIDLYDIGDIINSKIASFSQMPLLKFNNLLLINCLPETDYYEDPRFILFDMCSNKIIDNMNIADFIDIDFYDLLFTLNSTEKLSDNTAIISIGVNEKVFIYNVAEKQIIDSMVIKSNNFTNTVPLPKAQNIATRDRLERSYYISIYKVIFENNTFLFRTTTLSTEPYDVEGNLKTLYDKQKSVIIYDLSNRTKVGEYFLPKNIFDFREGFVYNNRIYFQLNNLNSPDDENLMKFVGYEVIKK